jgi:hypothetical protein
MPLPQQHAPAKLQAAAACLHTYGEQQQQQQEQEHDCSGPIGRYFVQGNGSNKCLCSAAAAAARLNYTLGSADDVAVTPPAAACGSCTGSSQPSYQHACSNTTLDKGGNGSTSTSSGSPAGAGARVITSIYDLFSRRQRIFMLAVCASAAALAPLADTIYIPSLYAVRQDLHTSQELVAATVRTCSLADHHSCCMCAAVSFICLQRPGAGAVIPVFFCAICSVS